MRIKNTVGLYLILCVLVKGCQSGLSAGELQRITQDQDAGVWYLPPHLTVGQVLAKNQSLDQAAVFWALHPSKPLYLQQPQLFYFQNSIASSM